MGKVFKQIIPLGLGLVARFLPPPFNIIATFGVMFLSAVLFKPKKPDDNFPTAGGTDRKQLIRSATSPHRVIYGVDRVGGTLVFSESTGADLRFLHLVVVWAGHECEEITTHYLNEIEIEPGQIDENGLVQAGDFKGKVLIRDHLGAAGQPADSDLVAAVPIWTPAHRLDGLCYSYFRFEYDRDVFPANIPTPNAVVRGRNDIFDPRDASAGWSDNWALCVRAYLAGDYGYEMSDDEIDDTLVIAAANVSDEYVLLAGAGSPDSGLVQRRYRCNGSFTRDMKIGDVLEKLMTAGAGAVSFSGGKWRMWAGAYQAPDTQIDETWLRGAVRMAPDPPLRDRFNAVKGTFTPLDPKADPEYPARTNASYEAADGGGREYLDLDLPFTNDSVMAQRIAEIALRKSRQGIRVELPCNVMGLTVARYDTVGLTVDLFGWSAKDFVVIDFRLADDGGTDLILMEEASSTYDWDEGQELTGDTAPDTTLADPRFVGTPLAFGVESGSSVLQIGANGTVLTRVRATWSAPAATPFMASYELAWRLQSDANSLAGGGWQSLQISGRNTDYVLNGPFVDGALYDFELYAVNSFGVRSAVPAEVLSHLVLGKTEKPPAPDTFTAQRQADGTRSFDVRLNRPPADVRVGGGFRIRYGSTAVTDWDLMTPLHEGLLTAFPFETSAPAAAGIYAFEARSVDSSDLESASRRITLFLGDPRLNEIIHAQFEHQDGWPGTLANCFVAKQGVADILEVSSTEDWDDLPDTWPELADTWDELLTVAAAFTYTTLAIDLGANQNFDPVIGFQSDGQVGLQMKTGSEADAGVVGAWQTVGQVSGARYVQLRATVTGGNRLEQLSILLDGDVTTEIFEDIDP